MEENRLVTDTLYEKQLMQRSTYSGVPKTHTITHYKAGKGR